MKRIFATALGLLAFAGATATAADLPRYQPVSPAYNPVYYWTGFYIGINGGGGWGESQWDGINKFDLSGGLIGGTIGYNWQVGQIVVGAEGDLDWSGVKGTTTALCAAGCETRNKWLATVRGRLGYAFDRFLPYITAGLAAGDINATRTGFPGGSASNAGWTVGAGLEVGVVNNVSIKAEY
ncbi:MAG: outer membrane protein, partial [Xanthobacteraceae bacterium]